MSGERYSRKLQTKSRKSSTPSAACSLERSGHLRSQSTTLPETLGSNRLLRQTHQANIHAKTTLGRRNRTLLLVWQVARSRRRMERLLRRPFDLNIELRNTWSRLCPMIRGLWTKTKTSWRTRFTHSLRHARAVATYANA